MIWTIIAVLTALAVLAILWPLARRGAVVPIDADRAFYEAQIAEIERDLARGVIAPADAETAKAEAARRLIAWHEASGAGLQDHPARRRAAVVIALVCVPAAALLLYGHLGNPGMPDLPLLARKTAPSSPSDIFAAVAKIEQHLAANPDDARGWEVLAPVYLKTGRPVDAARAWTQVIRIVGGSPDRYTAVGEALVIGDQGRVPPEAVGAFEKALELDPKFPQPRFYLGLAAEQAGEIDRARDIWTKLAADAPPGANWVAPVRERIAALGPQIKVPQPDELVARSITALPKDEQNVAIRAMVDRLAARLRDNGRDADGWLMLVNAYNVLKDSEMARDALSAARKALADDTAALDKLKILARQLGLEG